MIRILKLFKTDEQCTKQKDLKFFPAWKMIDILPDRICEGTCRSGGPEGEGRLGELDEGEIHRIKHAFTQLLYSDDASCMSCKSSTDKTLLHNYAVNFVKNKTYYRDDVFEMILFIIRMTIRHGCPVDARNNDGFTAKDLALKCIKEHNPAYGTEYEPLPLYTGFEKHAPRIVRLLDIFSAPSFVLPLEELAARVVLKWQIPYRDHLPSKLHKIISGF